MNELQENEQLKEIEAIFRQIMGDYLKGSTNFPTERGLYDKTVKVLEESLGCLVEHQKGFYKISWQLKEEDHESK